MAKLAFKNVTIQYPIYNSRGMSLRNQVLRLGTGGKIEAEAGQVNLVTALRDVSFELGDGDSIGLIGHNGSGKTTLLRAMAGIYAPVSGQVMREGSLATVFEIGAGMDLELSGYENIIRMGLMMGMTPSQARDRIHDIEEFTELGDFLQLPVRTYSSGMTMRLMFAMATSVKPEILLIDEMFGTGDAAFQEKAHSRMRSLINSSKIFVFASHSDKLLREYCKRIFSLDHGTLREVDFDVLGKR
ncbi:ABC transporter ATP-binding protein [Methylobacillus sp.]|uniref:ABC transporter ATP-binding protein n=1 Tax=Methylobacillus sp. TaxID=56818 RepID=UPI0012C82CEA|nr:ABC transporter ATP-binding protein [Methylobacillus sp.]MPS47921.1 ABC transporter ATP-binding protein [Methylobacillus sp.]